MPEHTDWHNIILRNKLAEIARDYVRKGLKIVVSGKIHYREYEYQGQKRLATEIHADYMELSDKAKTEKSEEQKQAQPQQQTIYPQDLSPTKDDFPF